MLRACAVTYKRIWDKSLPFAEFAYNNSYQASLQMSLFEALYGRKCRTPLNWHKVGEQQVFGTNSLEEASRQVKMIQERLRTAQSRQKSYFGKRRKDLSFQLGDAVYLKVSPLRGMRRFGIKCKLAPRYIGAFEITACRGEVAYLLALPEKLGNVHNVFHVSQLKKCFKRPEDEAQESFARGH